MTSEREAELRARWAELRRAHSLDDVPNPETAARVARILRGGTAKEKPPATTTGGSSSLTFTEPVTSGPIDNHTDATWRRHVESTPAQ